MRIRASVACALLVSTGLVSSGAMLVAAPATAAPAHTQPAHTQPAQTQLPGTDPADNTPRVTDGRVLSIVRIGDKVVVGGTFSTVVDPTTGKSLHRTGLFAFEAATGAVSTAFKPVLTTSPDKTPEVDVIVPNAEGTEVFVGGIFGEINGSGPARLQALKLSDGTRSRTFKNGSFSSRVYDAALAGDTLYVAGSFTSVDGKVRQGLASLDPSTGEVTGKVKLRFKGTAQGFGTTTVRKIDVTPDGRRLVAIGNFRSVSGDRRMQIAVVNTSRVHAKLARWSTSAFSGKACGSSWDSYMRDVSVAPDGSFFVVITTGGWGGSARLCDTASRWGLRGGGSQVPTWTSFTGGDTSWAVEVTGPVAYVGGHFRWWNNVRSGGGTAGPGAVAREGLAALDTRNGMPLSWDPTRTRGIGVFDFYVTDTELWAGSDTAWWGRPREQRDRLAAFPWDGRALPAEQLGQVPGNVVQLAPRGTAGSDAVSQLLVDSTAPTSEDLADPGHAWAQVRGAFMVDDTVYTGWSDGTFTKQTFDGHTFGAAEVVDVAGVYTGHKVAGLLTGDLSSTTHELRSMFYDPRTARLYFTRADSSGAAGKHGKAKHDGGLFYRAFSPESDVVGATRSSALRADSVHAIRANALRGAFLAGDWLYYVSNSGELRRIMFTQAGTFVGASEPVNATIDWAAQGLFLSTQ